MRDGTRKSRAPSGDDAVRIGVWNSKKPCSFMRLRMESMTAPRVMMFWCKCSRRRSRKRYLSLVSSGYSWSPNTGMGSSAAGPKISISRVDEQHAAMVADAVTPTREAGLDADVVLAERAAGMGAVPVHGDVLSSP